MPSEQQPNFQFMLEDASVGFIRCDPKGTISYLNTFASEVVGLAVGDDFFRYIVLPPGIRDLEDILAGDGPLGREFEGLALRHSSKDSTGFAINLRPLTDSAGGFDAIVYRTSGRADRDLTVTSADPLTGLLNREACFNELRRRLTEPDGNPVAVMFMDLDKFKEVNDTYGHQAGDQVLIATARQLAAGVRSGDVVGRLGGDEFLVIADAGPDGDAMVAIALAHRLYKAVGRPIQVGQVTFHTRVSIGLALGDPGRWSAERLVETADLAMYEAKSASQDGRPRVSKASASTGANFARRRRIKVDFAAAWETGQLYFEYQPIRRLSDFEVLGGEAFLRWHHPNLGKIGPQEIISVASAPDHLRTFTEWILKTTTNEWAQLRTRYPHFADKGLSVNIDPIQLLTDSYLDSHLAILDGAGLRLCDVILEVQDWDRRTDRNMADVLAVLANVGIPVALDFFGVGYNTLEFVKSVPVVGYKVDGAFTRSLVGPDGPSAAIIMAGLQQIADGLGLMTLAEGLQTPEQVERCAQLGFYCGQGFALGKAVRIDEFEERERRVQQRLMRSSTLESIGEMIHASNLAEN